MTDPVQTLRRFNRTWSQRVGVLEDSFLGSGRPLAPSRVLFEIGPDGATALDLRERLGFDSGHLSRLLRQLESEGLVRVVPDPDDGRRRVARLTSAGTHAWRDLDARSDDLARGLIDPLTPRQRQRLTDSLETADQIVRAATVAIDVVDAGSSAARIAVAAYFEELDRRFEGGFDPGTPAPAPAAGSGVFVVASSDGEPVACGGVQQLAPDTGEIKRMWVHADWRGQGLGGRMLRRLEAEAAGLGHSRVRLDTNSTLKDAITMYAAAGYVPTERYNDNPYAQHWFEKTL